MSADTILGEAFAALRALGLSVLAACTLTGRSRASHYRRLNPPARKADPVPQAQRAKPPGTLSDAERATVLEVINAPEYQDLSICQIWARELDEDRYYCSMSSMYRIARAAGQSRERRRLATHPAKVKPELVATGASQVWSWDITKLRGPAKGIWYHLYALIDIYSRYSPNHLVCAAEDSIVAADFIDEAVGRNGSAPHTVHADRVLTVTHFADQTSRRMRMPCPLLIMAESGQGVEVVPPRPHRTRAAGAPPGHLAHTRRGGRQLWARASFASATTATPAFGVTIYTRVPR